MSLYIFCWMYRCIIFYTLCSLRLFRLHAWPNLQGFIQILNAAVRAECSRAWSFDYLALSFILILFFFFVYKCRSWSCLFFENYFITKILFLLIFFFFFWINFYFLFVFFFLLLFIYKNSICLFLERKTDFNGPSVDAANR